MEQTREQEGRISVRGLTHDDLDRVTAIDAKHSGRRREEYFKLKFRENLAEAAIKISLAAEIEGALCGFLLARVYYGEFGTMEPTAVLDTIGVHPDFRHQGVGPAMLRQLRTNLAGIGVGRIQTEVSWQDSPLLDFFRREGFRLAERLCLELDLSAPRVDDEDEL